MSTVLESISRFKETVNSYTETQNEKNCNKILQNIDKIKTVIPQVYNEIHIANFLKTRSKIMKELAEGYVKSRIGSKFPFVKPELFSLKRHLGLSVSGLNINIVKDELKPFDVSGLAWRIEIPLFAKVPFIGDHNVALYKNQLKTSTTSYSVAINASLPGEIGENIRKVYRHVLSQCYDLISDLFKRGSIVDGVFDKLEEIKVNVFIIWIPPATAFNIDCTAYKPPVALDPAMILNFFDMNFLVATWEVENEEPMEKFLKEYLE